MTDECVIMAENYSANIHQMNTNKNSIYKDQGESTRALTASILLPLTSLPAFRSPPPVLLIVVKESIYFEYHFFFFFFFFG